MTTRTQGTTKRVIKRTGDTADPMPASCADVVFVYGALRSGTTAFRLMLDAHPLTVNPGEFDFLFDYLHADDTCPDGWRLDTDALSVLIAFSTQKIWSFRTGSSGWH